MSGSKVAIVLRVRLNLTVAISWLWSVRNRRVDMSESFFVVIAYAGANIFEGFVT